MAIDEMIKQAQNIKIDKAENGKIALENVKNLY